MRLFLIVLALIMVAGCQSPYHRVTCSIEGRTYWKDGFVQEKNLWLGGDEYGSVWVKESDGTYTHMEGRCLISPAPTEK